MSFMTFNDVAKETGVSLQTVRTWNKQGKLPTVFKFGSQYRVSVHDFEQWIEAQKIEFKEGSGVTDVE